MNIQRLKYAWARGAVIQVQIKPEYGRGSEWSGSRYNCTPPVDAKEQKEGRYNYRVHPKDAHLEYGLLSGAMRNTAIEGKTVGPFHAAVAALVILFPELEKGFWDLNENDRLMMWLFFAELMADEGL